MRPSGDVSAEQDAVPSLGGSESSPSAPRPEAPAPAQRTAPPLRLESQITITPSTDAENSNHILESLPFSHGLNSEPAAASTGVPDEGPANTTCSTICPETMVVDAKRPEGARIALEDPTALSLTLDLNGDGPLKCTPSRLERMATDAANLLELENSDMTCMSPESPGADLGIVNESYPTIAPASPRKLVAQTSRPLLSAQASGNRLAFPPRQRSMGAKPVIEKTMTRAVGRTQSVSVKGGPLARVRTLIMNKASTSAGSTFCCLKEECKYEFVIPEKQKVVFNAQESSTQQQRYFVGDSCREYSVKINEVIGDIVADFLFLRKKKQCVTLGCWCCTKPELSIYDTDGENGKFLGMIRDEGGCEQLYGMSCFSILDEREEIFYELVQEVCHVGLLCDLTCGSCVDIKFTIRSSAGQKVGSITRKLKACKASESFEIDFGDIKGSYYKQLIIAAAIFIDVRLFES